MIMNDGETGLTTNPEVQTLQTEFRTNNTVEADELTGVFESVGWRKNAEDIVQAFNNSFYVTAYRGNELVGFARAVSDGHYYTSIFDVVVKPAYQRQGIAKTMMKVLLQQFKGSYFFLSYTPGKREFYERCAFEDLPTAMWIDRQKSFGLDVAGL